jgi:hypothetical protein
MKRGYYQLAEQCGDIGAFAAVTVSVEQSILTRGLEIEFSLPYDVPEEWIMAAQFGVAYACEKLTEATIDGRPFRVTVHLIEGHNNLETTMTTVLFSAAMAVWNALNTPPPPNFDFDTTKAVLTLPQ